MTTTLQFQDSVPPVNRAKYSNKWGAVVAELRAHPGQWAMVIAEPTEKELKAARVSLNYHGCKCAIREGQVWASWPAE